MYMYGGGAVCVPGHIATGPIFIQVGRLIMRSRLQNRDPVHMERVRDKYSLPGYQRNRQACSQRGCGIAPGGTRTLAFRLRIFYSISLRILSKRISGR